MNHFFKTTQVLLVLAACAVLGLTQAQAQVHASFPFVTDVADATCNYGNAALLSNSGNNPTPPSAGTPLCVDGNVFLGGNYVRTPAITSIDLTDFSISVDFNIADLNVPRFTGGNPVIMLSFSWRTIGIEVNSTTGAAGLIWNNGTGVEGGYSYGSTILNTGQWYSAKLVYSGGVAELYIDGVLAHSENIPVLNAGSQFVLDISTNNGGNGGGFKGCIRNLLVEGPGGAGETCTDDRDADGVADADDNCPDDYNPLQNDVCGSAGVDEGVTSFTLINTVTNMPVPGYDPIPDGANIDLASFGNRLRDFNIRANTDGDDEDEIDDVTFTLTRGTRSKSRTESAAPYAIFGDRRGNYQSPNRSFQSVINHGTGDLTVEAYPIYDDGSVGDTYSLNFTVSDGANPLREFEQIVSMEIYPNPSNGAVVISGEIAVQTEGTLTILNPLGQVVYRQEISEDFAEKIDLSKHAKGLYLVKVEGKDFSKVGKLIIE